ncbi:MAG: metallophosphoesterase [Wolinella sp.]
MSRVKLDVIDDFAWLDERTFITSDNHFGHAKILKKEPERLDFMTAQGGSGDYFLWSASWWNQAVSPVDSLLCLGDLVGKSGDKYISELHGNKWLLMGNHDVKNDNRKILESSDFRLLDGVFLAIPEADIIWKRLKSEFGKRFINEELYLHALIIDRLGERIMFSHFPVFDHYKNNTRYNDAKHVLDVLFKESRCTINIHGHTHINLASSKLCINACVDRTLLRPIRLGKLLEQHKTSRG